MQINEPLVTVVTATTGSPYLQDVLESVKRQTYKNVEHFVVVDGQERKKDAIRYIRNYNVQTLILPYATGKDNYNGHRIYGSATYLSNGKYIMFLDEDNWIEPDHIQSLMDVINDGNKWAYSLRNIVDSNKNFICEDNCESLGKWTSVLNDFFVDVGCWFLPKDLALVVSPLWYRRARHPQEQPEVDRIITSVLIEQAPKYDCSLKHTLNYRVGNRKDSVQAEFFLKGNEQMLQYYHGKLPWKVAKAEEVVYINV